MVKSTVNSSSQIGMKLTAGTSVRIMLIVMLAMVTQIGIMTVDVFAGDAPATQYVDKKWENGQVVSETKTQDDVAWMTDGHLAWHDGWWYTRDLEKLVISDRVSVDNGATANLILMDGKTIEFENGIHVGKGSTLNIYGQAQGTGKLIVGKSKADTAAIGGNAGESCGTINIYGGTIQVTGGSHSSNGGAGIGAGGTASNESSINIYGGTITSTGGANAAGIGGGANGGHGGAISIYGGKVTANGDSGAAGIGGGEGGSGTGTFIHGGEVHANGGSVSSDGGAGIGSGNKNGKNGVVAGDVYVYGGKVYATGGADAAGIGGGNEVGGGNVEINGVNGDGAYVEATGKTLGAGIGGGQSGDGGTVTIHKGTVNVIGGSDGAGIGGGDKASGGTVNIHDGTVKAEGGDYAAGIGSGDADGDNINGGIVNILGGTVTATGGIDGAGIGGGEGADGAVVNVYAGKVIATGGQGGNSDGGAGIGSGDDDGYATDGNYFRIHGGEVYATGGADGAGIGGGDGCSGGDLFFWGGYTEATGGANAAGIGSGDADGDNKDGGWINIIDAKVKATGGKNGAGIGGGEDAAGGRIDITLGNEVTAIGGTGGAGIGGGDGGDSGNINIDRGTVIATGGDEAAGIGGGNQGSEDNPGVINIIGGKVTATGGKNYGAGIGGGDQQNSGSIYLAGCEVSATGGVEAAGIGGGNDGESNDITIKMSRVTAIGGERAAGIGSGSETGSCGNIKITDCYGDRKIVAKGGRLGAGIGGGYARYKDISGNITIKDSNIEATGGNAAAGIGSGFAEGMSSGAADGYVNTTIEGGNVTAVGGYNGGSGIGGGDNVVSGKILIEGGNINATGGENGGAGIGSGGNVKNKSLTTVDIEINGGNVTAKPGRMKDGVRTYPGVAIGLGGHDFYSGEPSNSFFNGTINLNAGEIVAYRAETETDNPYNAYSVIGVATDEDLSEVTGNVNFNGAHVQMYAADLAKVVRATNVTVKDSDDIHQQVDYKTGAYGPATTVLAADRVSTLTSTEKYYVEVKPCEHKDATYEDKGNDHSVACKNCNYSADEAHSYGEPAWTWEEDYSRASAKISCVCTHALESEATVTSKKNDDGTTKTYTAKATLDGKEYQDVKTVELPPVEVKTMPSYKDLTYTGEQQQLGTPGEVTGGTLKYALGTDGTTAPADSEFKDTVPSGKEVGTYYVWCKAFGDDDHRDSVAQSGTVKILKQTVTDPTIPAKFFIEGVTQKADVPESDLYTVTKNDGGIDIGEYDVVLELTDTDNYKWIDSEDKEHTLKFRIVEDTANIVTVSIDGWTYGETAKEPEVTATYGVSTVEITYAKSQEGPWAEDKPSDAGIWWVKATVPAGDGYPAGDDTARFEIAKAAPTVMPPTGKSLTYTGKDQELANAGTVKGVVEEAAGGTMLYAVMTEDAAPDDSAYSEDVPKATDTGIYYVWYKVEGDDNHKDYEPHKVTSKISADKSELEEAVSDAEEYYNSIKDDEDNKSAADKLKDAIDAAEKVKADPVASQKDVDDETEALKEAVAKAKDDIAKADPVKDQINALPDPADVSLDDKEAIEAAGEAYDKLTDDQKDLIPDETKKKLTDAEKALEDAKKAADEEAAATVRDQINALPEKPGYNDRPAVEAARDAYDKLTEDQKKLVGEDALKKLEAAEKSAREAKPENDFSVKGKNKTLTQKDIKEKAHVVSQSDILTISNAKGKLTYEITSMNTSAYRSRFTIDKNTGALTIAKSNLPGGTYRMNIRVTDDGGGKYMSSSKIATVEIKVKGENPISVTGRTATLTQAAVKTKTRALSRPTVLTVKNAKGRLTYDIMAMSTTKYRKMFNIDRNSGTVIVTRSTLPKGAYRMRVRVIAAGDSDYTPIARAVDVTIVIK